MTVPVTTRKPRVVRMSLSGCCASVSQLNSHSDSEWTLVLEELTRERRQGRESRIAAVRPPLRPGLSPHCSVCTCPCLGVGQLPSRPWWPQRSSQPAQRFSTPRLLLVTCDKRCLRRSTGQSAKASGTCSVGSTTWPVSFVLSALSGRMSSVVFSGNSHLFSGVGVKVVFLF